MNKKFTLSLFVLLLMVIGLPSAFAQVTTRTVQSDSALWVDIKAGNTLHTTTQTAINGHYGMDSTTFTGAANGYKVTGKVKQNVIQSAGMASAAFIRFEDSPADTALAIKAFKFHVNDTIFVTFHSKYSPTATSFTTSQQRFTFDAASNNAVAYQVIGSGASSVKFHPVLSNRLSGPQNLLSTGTLDLSGVTGDTIMLVIDAVPPFATTVNTQILLSDINIKPLSSWLQGQTEVRDTLIAAYGRFTPLYG